MIAATAEEEEEEIEVEGKKVIIKTTKYENLIPISKTDYEALRSWIAEDMELHYPIIINRHGDVLDGHNRLKICKEFGIKPYFKVKYFFGNNELLEEEKFVRLINVNRRQMNDFQKAGQGMFVEHIEAELARQRKLSGTPLGPDDHKGKTRDLIAKQVGLSSGKTYERIKTAIKAAQESPEYKLEQPYGVTNRSGNGATYTDVLMDAQIGKLSPSRAYSIVKHEKEIIRKRAEAKAFARELELPYKFTPLHADSTKFEEEISELRDSSVDLILTDPPYANGDESLAIFESLAKLACAKLKDGGSLAFFYGVDQEPQVHEIFRKYKEQLTWWGPLHVRHQGHGTRLHARGIWVEVKDMMWFVKGKKKLFENDIHNFLESSKPDKDKHPWAQSRDEAEYIIKNMTVSEHSLVLDPFMGSGAFVIPAIKLNRWVIGIEIDKQVFDNANSYIKSEVWAKS